MSIDDRHRDKNGEISRRQGNTLVSTLRNRTLAAGEPDSEMLENVLAKLHETSLTQPVEDASRRQSPAGGIRLTDVGSFRLSERDRSLPTDMSQADREALRKAVGSLEHPGLAARLTNVIGKPVELIGYELPSFASKAVALATSKGLEAALKVALRTLSRSSLSSSQLLHRALATLSGAAGGTFGLAALPVELPVSTVIMLRSIADIAQSEGEDLSSPENALSCVEVFALGARAGSADATESGYFAVRGMLANTVAEAARFVAERGVIREGAPIVLKFVSQIAARFGLVVTQNFPVVGALGGAAVNYAFH